MNNRRLCVSAFLVASSPLLNVLLSTPSIGQTASTERLKAGERAFATQDLVLIGGPDKGKVLEEGAMVRCTKIEEDQVWISGCITGWVPRSLLVPISSAEDFWKERVSDRPKESKQHAILALVQVQTGLIDEAATSVNQANALASEGGSKIRLVEVAIAVKKEGVEAAKRKVLALCKTSRLTDYDSALLLSLLSAYPDLELREQVLQHVHFDSTTSSCWLLTEVARIKGDQGNYQAAKKLLDNIIKRDPWYANALLIRSIIQQRLGSLHDAVADVEKYLELRPDNSIGYSHLSSVYFAQGHRDKGIDCLRKVVELNPDDPEAYATLGVELFRNSLLDQTVFDIDLAKEPIQLFEKACELSDYENLNHVRHLAITYASVDQPKKVGQLLDRCLTKFGDSEPYRSSIEETRKIAEGVLSLSRKSN